MIKKEEMGAFALSEERKEEISNLLPKGKPFGETVLALGALEEEGKISEMEAAAYCADMACTRRDLTEEDMDIIRNAEVEARRQSRQADLLRDSDELAYLKRITDDLTEFLKEHAEFLKAAGFSLLLDMRLAGKRAMSVTYGPAPEVGKSLQDLTKSVMR